MTMLQHAGLADFARLRLLEVGCGAGGNLLRFLRWGLRLSIWRVMICSTTALPRPGECSRRQSNSGSKTRAR